MARRGRRGGGEIGGRGGEGERRGGEKSQNDIRRVCNRNIQRVEVDVPEAGECEGEGHHGRVVDKQIRKNV